MARYPIYASTKQGPGFLYWDGNIASTQPIFNLFQAYLSLSPDHCYPSENIVDVSNVYLHPMDGDAIALWNKEWHECVITDLPGLNCAATPKPNRNYDIFATIDKTVQQANKISGDKIYLKKTSYIRPGHRIKVDNDLVWVVATDKESITVEGLKRPTTGIVSFPSSIKFEVVKWKSNIARANQIGSQNGIDVHNKKSTYRWIGTIRTSSNAKYTTDRKSQWLLWNRYNRIEIELQSQCDNTTHEYQKAKYREYNGDNTLGVSRIGMVRGQDIDIVTANAGIFAWREGCDATMSVGIGVDNSTQNSANQHGDWVTNNGKYLTAVYKGLPGSGFHTLRQLEWCRPTGIGNWVGRYVDGWYQYQGGMSATIKA